MTTDDAVRAARAWAFTHYPIVPNDGGVLCAGCDWVGDDHENAWDHFTVGAVEAARPAFASELIERLRSDGLLQNEETRRARAVVRHVGVRGEKGWYRYER